MKLAPALRIAPMMQMTIRQAHLALVLALGLTQMTMAQMTTKTVITLAVVQAQTRVQAQMTTALLEGTAQTINQPTPVAK